MIYKKDKTLVFHIDNDDISKKLVEYIESDLTLESGICYGVTRILSSTKDNSFLDKWRASIGEEEADRIVKESQDIGNSLDKITFEHYNDDFTEESYKDELGYNLYRQLKPHLCKIVPLALQLKVWSKKYGMQGYIDCLGYYKGVLSVIDFKNTKKVKSKEHYYDYLLQTTLYCILLKLMFDIEVKQIVLLMAVRNDFNPQIIVESINPYIQIAMNRVNEFNKTKLDNKVP